MQMQWLSVAVVSLITIGSASASTWVQQLGNSNNWVDGQTPGTATWTTTDAGGSPSDPPPFGVFNGSDSAGPNFDASWTFNFGSALNFTVFDAQLVIGSYDFDTNDTTVSHVQTFTLNGLNLKPNLDALFQAN